MEQICRHSIQIRTARTSSVNSCAYACPYIILDTETTGLSPYSDKIIQLSAIRYDCSGVPISYYDTYINPGFTIPSAASAVNKINDTDVCNAPTIDQIQSEFLSFWDGALIVGYNVAFDLRFLNEAFPKIFIDREYVDILPIARAQFCAPDYKLTTISTLAGFIPEQSFHDSFTDCEAVAAVLKYCADETLLTTYTKRFQCNPARPPHMKKKSRFREIGSKTELPFVDEIICNPDHPLFGKSIVFTGELSFSRGSAISAAEHAGAIIRSCVSKKTDYLIVGTQDISIVGDDGMSGKEERAYSLNASGAASIRLLSEREFLELLLWNGGQA